MVPFTIEDFDSAIEKIGEKLSNFAMLSSDSVQLMSFSGRMTPFTFKMQLESCFLVKLRNAEVRHSNISMKLSKYCCSGCKSYAQIWTELRWRIVRGGDKDRQGVGVSAADFHEAARWKI